MIAIIDYGMGNVHSIANMFTHLNIDSFITKDAQQILEASHLVLPGVGAFDQAMTALEALGLIEVIHQFHHRKKPILGICLGMQLLGTSSEEGVKPGLGLISFKNIRFSAAQLKSLRIPHMGWNEVSIVQDHLVTQSMLPQSRFYFVHSYYAGDIDESDVLLTCEYGHTFAAAVHKDNVYGVQFHPEKSHAFGMALLQAFAEVS
jgi:imidazole glycerol-phosphate synthase subunit HisH